MLCGGLHLCRPLPSVLGVLLGLELGHDAFQLPLRFTLREIAHLVVLGGDFNQPERTGGQAV